MFYCSRNTDTTKATESRKKAVMAFLGNKKIGYYRSLKECSAAIGVPSSKICEYARSGRIYKGGLAFKYG